MVRRPGRAISWSGVREFDIELSIAVWGRDFFVGFFQEIICLHIYRPLYIKIEVYLHKMCILSFVILLMYEPNINIIHILL